MRTRDIERFGTTVSAEMVYGSPRVELVLGKVILALQQSEVLGINDEVQIACGPAYGTVAFNGG